MNLRKRLLVVPIVGAALALAGVGLAPVASAADSGLQYINRTTANGLGSNWVKAVFVDGSKV